MRVLYVCTGNSFRSPVAEALTRKYRPKLEVESAGTDPASHIAENGKELLEVEGAFEYVKPDPDPLSQRALDKADTAVAMKDRHKKYILENFGADEENIEVWDVEDPIGFDVDPEEAFHEIKEKVRKL
ncbi:MAG: hypothetical protein ACLFTQ_00305 [Candidatus Aenigmatarchaeota archaeon]